MNHYETLGVSQDASAAEIKAAYRSLASKYHPDREGGDAEKMAQLTLAYRILENPEKRSRYDRTGMDEHEDGIEVAAHGYLSAGFEQFLDQNDDHPDPVGVLRKGLLGMIDLSKDEIASAKRDLHKLEKRAKRIRRRKEGKDLLAIIVGEKRKKLLALVEREESEIKSLDLALAMIDEYESTPPEHQRAVFIRHSHPTLYGQWREDL